LMHNDIRTFWSGLTREEKRDARSSLDILAHPISPCAYPWFA
jgi:hypothetical protein